MSKWWQLICRQNNWKNNWFIGTFLIFWKNLYFSLFLFSDWTTGFGTKIWVKKRPHKSILGKHTQTNPNRNFFLISNHDLFWSQDVPWIMFMTKTNIVFKTNWFNICIWAKTLVPYWKSKSRKIQISDLLHLRLIRFWLSNFSASFAQSIFF